MGRLNMGQRVVIVIGLGAALLLFGEWAMTWGTHYYTGWTGYAPLTVPLVGGLQPWARLLIWLGLVVVWVAASAIVFRTSQRMPGGDVDR